MAISSSAQLPARSPMPLIAHSTWRAPPSTAASELATAMPRSLWQWVLKTTSRAPGTFADQALEQAADLRRRGVAQGVGHVDGGGAGGDRRGDHFGQEILLGAGAVLGGEFDVVDEAARVRDAGRGQVQHLLLAHAQLVLAMQRAGGDEQVQARLRRRLQRARRDLDVVGQAARQHAQGGVAQFARDQRGGLAIGLRAGGETGLDDVDAEFGQRARHHQFLRGRHAAAGRLFAVAQGGIEYSDLSRDLGRLGNDGAHQVYSSSVTA